ncbi:F-box protein PP2-B11-like isoform X1 [Cucurbita maxima]|uniref:F-box protein PP2-B11-like isoform X1 n=1 Tax=Cucurbita maxima TaxID=3661 RepID=A0A6J1KTW8_CUCMA|nr:F-box protein PP2-B11-like isoform X1 [Cucurbita maxima]
MEDMDWLTQLPEECISRILALTPVKDGCRAAAVSRTFRSIATSDAVWEARLPSDIKDVISQSSSPSLPEFLNSLSRKDLYFHLSDHPLLIGTGNTFQSFGLEKESGKVRYMRGAKDLKIVWSDTPQYWRWEHDPQSRFGVVARLDHVWWLEIEGRIEARKLSLKTNYAAHFVFKLTEEAQVFERKPVKLRVYSEGDDTQEAKQVLLEPPEGAPTQIRERQDGWIEVHMGEFYNDLGDDGSIIFNLQQLARSPYQGLIVEGIEIRPVN